jgi:DHA2 family multidrug resistance protein-like MFS transporter
VASAINSTARELGGALGVAILGSLSAPIYAAGVRPATASLPVQTAGTVHDSLAGAGVVASYLPAPQGAALLGAARSAFVDGMDVAVLVGAVVAIAGAAVAFALLPGRTQTAGRQVESERIEVAAGSSTGLVEAA